MTKVGRTTKRYYKETKGVKVSGGQRVKAGTMLTREGHQWKPGRNVVGRMHLTSVCDGEVYFSKRKSRYKKEVTYINIRPVVNKEKIQNPKP